MKLGLILSHKKTAILERWFQQIIESYPPDSSALLLREKDRFTNPVGYTIRQAIDSLYDEPLGEMNAAHLSASLDAIIRIRSVQDFSPARAISFVFLLKKAVKDELDGELLTGKHTAEFLELYSRIDEMALLAFDIYMTCREKVYQLRLSEIKTGREQAFHLLEKIGMACSPLEEQKGNNNEDMGLA